jgi:hypothetical protein
MRFDLKKMDKSQVREAIYQGLSRILVPAGFKGKKKDLAFVRSMVGGSQKIEFSLVDYRPMYRFAILTSFRVDAVEDLKNPFEGIRPESWHETATLRVGEEKLGVGVRFDVTSEAEIAQAMDVLDQRFRETILPFLDAHADLPAIERMPNGSQDRPSGGPLEKYAMAGVAAAVVCRRPDVDDIIALHRKRISGYYEEARQRFEALVAHISTLS